MDVRKATAEDSKEALDTLRNSISQLCLKDHGNDTDKLASWLGNKTKENWNIWLHNPDIAVYVADLDGKIVGVGMFNHQGEILLNYVSPRVRFQGVSKALMVSMESAALQLGLDQCQLTSTRTARDFYRSLGYEPIESELDGLRMRKSLTK